MRTTPPILVLLALIGCSCGAPAASSSGSTTPPSTSSSTPADYEVHEWGLIRAEPGDVLRIGSIAPPVSYAALSVDKPVLYFHTTSPLTLASVTVQMPQGSRIAEAWPLVAFGDTARWENVALDPTATCAYSALPTASEAPCAQLGSQDQCESLGLNVVRTTDAACVHVGAATEGFLFYRARAAQFTPPLVFERTQVYEQVEVRNEGDAPIPGLLVRLWSDGMRTRALAVAPPAPHASVVVGNDFDAAAATARRASDEDGLADMPVQVDDESTLASTVEPARAAIRAAMLELGLTNPEADVFLGAWSAALFPQGGATIDTLTDRSVDGDPAPRESFLYFLPEPRTEEISTLTFDPPPRAVHRAIAVWSPLRSSGSSH